MHLNSPTVLTCSIVATAAIIATPVLIKGFTRRGTGIKYEKNFLIQRAPQFATLLNVILIVISFIAYNNIIQCDWAFPCLAFFHSDSEGLASLISWLGVALLISGLVFTVGGWYSLGEFFSTDAEVLDGHAVRNTGLYKYVMHPIYSGIIQALLGASLAATSPLSVLFALLVVAPLWLERVKYEEKILTETLGPQYSQYAQELRGHRLLPRIF